MTKAKDPAFLFYPNDWLGGTMGMSFEEKGAYMELMLMQFNTGKFTEDQAKQVLSICSENIWQAIKSKFKTNGKLYWNVRLATEIKRRKKFTKSRRNNLKGLRGKIPHMEPHMETETENETETITENNKGGTGGDLIREEKIAVYQKLTDTILVHDDQHFEQLAMKERITITPEAVKDHLALLCRYPNMQPGSATEFRQSLLKHCKEFKIKTDGTKPKDEFLGTFNLTKARKTMDELRELDEQERAKNANGANG